MFRRSSISGALVTIVILAGATVQAAPIHDAARQGDLEAIRVLIVEDPSSVDLADGQGQTPLHHAVIANRGATVRFLIDTGAAPDPTNRAGQTPLFIAMDRGRNRSACDLLDAGASHRHLGSRAVGMAVRSGSLPIVERLVVQGAPIDADGPGGLPPLAMAVARDRADMAEFLLRHGADPQTRLIGGAPVICWAAANGRADMVALLIDAGADLMAMDPTGRSPLDLARRYGHSDTAAALSAAGGTGADGVDPTTTRQWLDRQLDPGEAVLWHLGHCGWAIKTQQHVLIFDYVPDSYDPAHPGLANGRLTADELRNQNVWIFVTHAHRDHFDPAIYALADRLPTVNYVYGFAPDADGGRSYAGPAYSHMPPRTERDFGDLSVATIASNDAGVGFLVTVDGVTVYHAGDHAGWRDDERTGFTAEIDHLAGLTESVDLAFVNVTGCHAHGQCPLEDGTQYTQDRLKPAAWFPTHAGGREYLYLEFAASARARGASEPTACPAYRGDVYHFRRQSVVVP